MNFNDSPAGGEVLADGLPGGSAPDIIPNPIEDARQAAEQIKDRAQQVWRDLSDFGPQFVNQLKAAAAAAYSELLNKLHGVRLTHEQIADAQWATNKLLAVGVLSIGADAEQLRRLDQDRRDALSVLADIAAIKALNGEQLVKQMFGKALGLARDFILQGAGAAIGRVFTAL